MNETPAYSIGIDFGTHSVRALIVDTRDGRELATHQYDYPSGKDGVIVDPRDPNVARQNPADYIEGFLVTVREALCVAQRADAEFRPDRVAGIGVDTTGSTPIPVDRDGVPLAMKSRFRRNLAAQAWLWTDRTAHAEAAEITALARKRREPYLAKCGGTYSFEGFWAKLLRCLRTDPEVFDAAYSWVELCDFVPAYITGNTDPLAMRRGICAAGHKALFSEQWGGLPSQAFLKALAPRLAELRDRLYTDAYPSDRSAGALCQTVASKVGLPEGIPVAVGAFDAHHGAVGAGIRPGTLVKLIGAGTCDILVARPNAQIADIPGVCGIVKGSVLPDAIALEAGQAAVGDIFSWYVNTLGPSAHTDGNPYANLEQEAAALHPGESGLVALDWNNGNRTILANPLLTGLLIGQTLHTTATEIYRALVEATAFGALTIMRRVEEHGIKVREVIHCGGLAEKSPFMMQIYADVTNRTMKLSRSAQTCPLGAAIFGAVVGGAHSSTVKAQRAMAGIKEIVYKPIPSHVRIYARLYKLYLALHDAFGGVDTAADLSHVMRELVDLRRAARQT